MALVTNTRRDLTGLAAGTVEFKSSTGETVKLALAGEGLPKVWRNGALHDWAGHRAVYSTVDDKEPYIRLGWKERVLEASAGGHRFRGELREDGSYVVSHD